MSCIYKIKEAQASFTSTEKIIADYILENQDKVIEKSAQELGVITNTSAAAWIRFSKRLGYKGLTAMKVDIAKTSGQEDENFDLIIEESDTIDVLIKKVNQMSVQHINKTYKLLNVQMLQNAINCINNADKIYLTGIGGSGIVCLDLLQKFTRIDKDVIYHEDPHVLMARIAHIKPNDVLIAISYSGETKIVNTAAEYAKKNNTPVIAITQYNIRSTLSSIADIKLYTPIVEKELRLGAISSRNSALSLIDLIYYGITKLDLEKSKNNLVKTRSFIHELDKNKEC